MPTGYLVTLGNNSLDAGDVISGSTSTFTQYGAALGTGSWTWTSSNGSNTVIRSGVYYLGTNGNVYFILDIAPPSGGTATVTSAPPYVAGVVDGTSGNDLIDSTYTGDPHGDRPNSRSNTINAGAGNDTVNAGSGNDVIDGGSGNDTIDAGASNDTVTGGLGNDTIYGSGGNDSISGNDGNDVIYGDNATTATATTEHLSWINQGASGTNIIGGFTQDTGGMRVTAGFVNNGGNTGVQTTNTTQYVGTGPYSATSGLYLTGNAGPNVTTTLTFNSEVGSGLTDSVTGVNFIINDVDMSGWQDIVTVNAYDINGNPVAVTLSPYGNDTVSGNTITAANTSETQASTAGAVQVSISGAVHSIEIIYSNAGTSAQALWITDVYYQTVPAVDGNDSIDGGAGTDSIYGGGGNDIIQGGTGSDSIFGGTGNDTITDSGTEGDYIDGGAGDDSINAGVGVDTVYGGDGNDVIDGGENTDIIYGGAGDDTITDTGGSLSDDTIYGDAGNDTIFGGAREDRIYGGADNDLIYGGADNDVIDGDAGNDSIFGGTGNDRIFGGNGTDSIVGELGDDTIYGGAGNDYVDGDDVNDTLFGDDGNDVLVADAGNDTLYGGIGDHGLYASGGNNTAYGDAGNDSIYMGTGNDVISGGDGNDSLYGGDGNDNMSGDAGNDRLEGGAGDDQMAGGAGTDTLYGDAGNDTLYGDATSADTFYGGTGNDLIYGGNVSGNASYGGDGVDTITDGSGNGTIDGGAGDDFVYAGAGNDVISGGTGSDFLDGGADNDTMYGGTGNDILTGGAGADRMEGGDDADTFYGGAGDVVIGGEGGNDNDVLILSNVESITYGGGNNEAGTVTFTAASGGGTMTFSEIEYIRQIGPVDGTNASDTMNIGYVDANGDTIDGADGVDDTIFGYAGNDTIFAGAGNDKVYGGDGNDRLYDGSGNDTLYGGAGYDRATLESGAGNDIVYDVETVYAQGDIGDDTLIMTSGTGYVAIDENWNLTFSDATNAFSSDGTYTLTLENYYEFDAYGATNFLDASNAGQTIQYNTWSGDHTVIGSSFDDAFFHYGATGTSVVYLGAGNDHAEGSDLGDDSLFGGDGNDYLVGDGISSSSPGGNDLLDGGAGNDALYGDSGNDTLIGGTGDDSIYGGNDADIISVEDDFGNDTILGGEGAINGTDNDTLDLSATTTGVTVDLTSADPEAGTISDGTSTATFKQIENIVLGGGADTVVLASGSGSDTVLGFAAPTDNGDGTFTGTDTLDVTNMLDAGGDPVNFHDVTVTDTNGDGTGDAILKFPNGESITLIGIPAADADNPFYLNAIGIPLSDGIVYGTTGGDLIDASYTGYNDGDMIDGSDAILAGDTGNDDVVYADSGDDTIIAGDGNDEIHAGSGNDTLFGDGDNDTLYGQEGDDTSYGGAGDDIVESWIGNDVIYGGDGNDIVLGGSDVGTDALYGGAGNDSLSAGGGNDILDGGTGDDNQYGAGGDDTFVLNDNFGDDTIAGGETDETTGDVLDASGLTGNATLDLSTLQPGNPEMGTLTVGSDTATFHEIENVILGSGDDTVLGSSGNDTVTLGTGADTVTGGAGNDTIDLGNGAVDGDADVVVLADGFGDDVVSSFEAPTDNGDGNFTGIDTLDVTKLLDAAGSPVNVNDVTVTDTNGVGTGDAILTFPNGESITLIGIPAADADNPFYLNAMGIPMPDGTVEGTAGDDTIDASYTGDPNGDMVDDNDAILVGDIGNDDLIYGYDGDDSISAGNGNDEVYGGDGSDNVSGDAGDDTLYGGAGYDTVSGGDGNDTVFGDDGSYDDLYGGAGNDTIYAGNFFDNWVYGGDGDDTIYGGNSYDSIEGGSGNDYIAANGGDDDIVAGAGDYTIVGGEGADNVDAGTGNDTIVFADGDNVSGGDGDDLITFTDLGETTNGAINIVGGNGGETLGGGDTLQLGEGADLSTLVQISDGINASGNETFHGSVTMDDGTLLTFSEIENIICFTPGTMIATPKGARDIATLRVGDLVVTRDHGLQPIRWIQSRTVPAMDRFAPIRIRPGVVTGQERDLLVSPQHRMLFQGYRAELLFGESEVLVSAKHLVDGHAVTQDQGGNVTFIHMMFDEHEVVFAEGAATESVHPSDVGLTAVTDAAREELFTLFPELRTNVNGYGQTARRCLKRHEAELLII